MVLLQALVHATGQIEKWTSRAIATLMLQCSLTIHDMELRAGPCVHDFAVCFAENTYTLY